MKVVVKPVEMIAWFENGGNINPVKFRVEGDNDILKVVKIGKVLKRSKEKIAGNNMLIFTCSSVVNGIEKIYELKYDIDKFKWYLFKI